MISVWCACGSRYEVAESDTRTDRCEECRAELEGEVYRLLFVSQEQRNTRIEIEVELRGSAVLSYDRFLAGGGTDSEWLEILQAVKDSRSRERMRERLRWQDLLEDEIDRATTDAETMDISVSTYATTPIRKESSSEPLGGLFDAS